MKNTIITVKHDQSSIDPSGSYTDEQLASVKKSYERELEKAILAEYPEAEVEFTGGCGIRVSDDPDGAIGDRVHRLCEAVYETGMFWE